MLSLNYLPFSNNFSLEKVKRHGVLDLGHRGCRTTGMTLLAINACTNKADQSGSFCSNLLHA